MKCYRIKNWEQLFETSESRKRLHLPWVAIPTKHDGKGYRRLIREFGPAVYGAWILIVAVAAKCPTRGTLADTDGPLSALDISDKTDCPVAVIEQSLSVLTDGRIGWLELVDLPVDQQIKQISAARPSGSAGTPVLPDQTRQYITTPDQTSTSLGAGTGVSAKRTGRNWGKSVFVKLTVEHLSDTAVMADWFLYATTEAESPLFSTSGGYSQANFLFVISATERALEEGNAPLKLFKALVGKERRELITQQQEDRARLRL